MPFTNTKPPIYFEVKGSGPPIIFSHGLMMDHEMFEDQVSKFSSSYTCISWDERGHGKTAQSECPEFSYYDSAADLFAILDALNIEKAILVGMSQGGFLSLRATLTHPNRVKALILIDSQAGLEIGGEHSSALAASIEAGQLSDDACTYIASKIMDPDWHGTPRWIAKWKTYTMPNVVSCMHTLVSRDDITEKIQNVKAPTLIIHGSRDAAIPVERAEKVHEQIKGSKLAIIDGENHAPNMTAPGKVNSIIDEFLSYLDK